MGALLLDAGPLVAHILCGLRPDLAGQHRRAATYSADMVERLCRVIDDADRHISLPNVLTEASNHLRSGEQEAAPGAAAALARYISGLDEIFQQSADVIRYREYAALGLADTAIFSFSTRFKRQRFKVVTQDWQLYNRLHSEGVDCLNVFHWRTPDRR